MEARAGIEPALHQGIFVDIRGCRKTLVTNILNHLQISLYIPKLARMFLLPFLLITTDGLGLETP